MSIIAAMREFRHELHRYNIPVEDISINIRSGIIMDFLRGECRDLTSVVTREKGMKVMGFDIFEGDP